MENKKGFIFDLDGVIVDTAKYHYLAWKNLANSINIDFTEVQNEQLKGVSRKKSLQKILKWGGVKLEDDKFMELMSLKNDDYLNHISGMSEDEILVDVPKILSYIRETGHPLALGSASKNARSILRKVNLLSKFDAIVDGNDVSKAKPDPEVFLNAARLLKVKPENCVVFEDALAGIQAANAAKMISVGIGERDILGEADYVFKDFSEFDTNFIDELIATKQKV
ncbi:beta-phosphoglucomutase [Flavobacteriaceae bacterium MAR_2010_188]|nr:beta-phosphoglucomutase [Flavobacteriaceae bacterium MAR_2010_188]